MTKEFQLEKILSISATEYCAMTEERIEDFRPVAVHIIQSKKRYKALISMKDLMREFQINVPENTAVVVNFSCAIAAAGDDDNPTAFYQAFGTALVHKVKDRKDKEEE